MGFALTSNCHRSTCSLVSLSVITTTSLEILLPTIHLFNCDMIFLMYALTWSSDETSESQFQPFAHERITYRAY